jgi:hypothetical protein
VVAIIAISVISSQGYVSDDDSEEISMSRRCKRRALLAEMFQQVLDKRGGCALPANVKGGSISNSVCSATYPCCAGYACYGASAKSIRGYCDVAMSAWGC